MVIVYYQRSWKAREKYGLTWLLRRYQMYTFRGRTLKELVSHMIQLKEKGFMLYSILNYYPYNTYGP